MDEENRRDGEADQREMSIGWPALGQPPENSLLLWDQPRLERNPAAVYIRRLGSPASRRVMVAALNTIATEALGVPRQIRIRPDDSRRSRKTAGENVSYLYCAWSALRHEHTSAIRDWLAAQTEPGGDSPTGSQRNRQTLAPTRYAPATVNRMLAALRGVLKEAWRLGDMNAQDYHRAAHVQNITATSLPRGRSLTHGELTTLLASCSPTVGYYQNYRKLTKQLPRDARDAALIAMLYSIGLRRFEIVTLDLDDYDPETGAVHIRFGNGRKERKCFLATGAIAAMDDWLTIRGSDPGPLFFSIQKGGVVTGKRLSDQAIYHILQVRQRQAHLPPFSPHDLRRTCVGDLLDAGVDVTTAKQIVGHTSVESTAKYDRRGDRAKKAAADKLHVPYSSRLPASRSQSVGDDAGD